MELSLFGCRIKIDFWFILVLSVSALFSADNLLYILLFSCLHECGHLIALYIFKGKADVLMFSYYGFALRYTHSLSKIREAVVIIAGPIVNLLLYLILRDDYNLILFSINMVPVYPLDAGRLVDLFFFRATKKISIIFLIMLIIFSVYILIRYNSYSMLLITVYLLVYSIGY